MRRPRKVHFSFIKFVCVIVCVVFYPNICLCTLKEFSAKFLPADRKIPGKMEGKIVRGAPVDIERYPWSVLVFNSGSLCAGTILNSYTVVSAAHCFSHNKNMDEISVHVGSRFRYDLNATIHSVMRIVHHEDYNKAMAFSCDIALVFLDTPIKFSKRAQKAVLVPHNKWMNKNEKGFTVTGWGMIKYNGPLSELGLLMAKLKYIPSIECGEMHSVTLTPDMFCLYGDALKDSCSGDSGGGVLWQGFLVGIVSHGDGCAGKNKPSIYTNVWYFREWLEDTVFKHFNTYCSVKKSHNVEEHHNHNNRSIAQNLRYTNKSYVENQRSTNKSYDSNLINRKRKLIESDERVARIFENITNNNHTDDNMIDKLFDKKSNISQTNTDQTDQIIMRNKYIKLTATA